MGAFRIVVPVYNAEPWIARCIGSLRGQTDLDWTAVVMDDASTDGTAARLAAAVDGDPRFVLVRVQERRGGLANIMAAIDHHRPADEDVIITVDGDDWLAHQHVLGVVRRLYDDPQVRMTYGQARQVSDGALHPADAYPEEVVRARSFRCAIWRAVHLRTFKYGLWRRIRPDDLLDPGTGMPWAMAWDCAFMYPMLEMCAPGQAVFGGEVLYIYNDVNPIGDNKVDVRRQRRLELMIRGMPRYG